MTLGFKQTPVPDGEATSPKPAAPANSRSIRGVPQKDRPETAEDPRAALARLHVEYDTYRERMQAEGERMRLRGQDDVATALLDIVDDFDRALSHITPAFSESDPVASGVEQLLARVLRRFAELGYQPFGQPGDLFDPRIHEAVSVEPGVGTDGSILRVHRRGWMRGETVVRSSAVTVLRGTAPSLQDEPVVRRRRLRPAPDDYVCPYGTPGCNRDCPGCTPIAEDDIMPESDIMRETDPFAEEEFGAGGDFGFADSGEGFEL